MNRFLCLFACFCCMSSAAADGGIPNMSSMLVAGKDKLAVVGFSIDASVQLLLIRVTGPSLQSKVLEPCLKDPVLVIYRDKQEIYRNDDWHTGPESLSLESMRQVEKLVGAFPIGENSLDAALVVALPKGGYTIMVEPSPKNPDVPQSGLVLIEIYKI